MPSKHTSGRRAQARTDGRRSRWDAHRAARREELIAAVVAVVRDAGADVSMDDIAHQSGIAKPVFYRYFADKADLHAAVGQSVARTVVGRVTEALTQEGGARSQLAAGLEAYLTCVEADPELYRFVVRSRTTSRLAGADPMGDFASEIGIQASRMVGDLLRRSGADAGAAETWGFGLVGMVRAAADRWLEHPAISRAALVDYLLDLVMPGIAAVLPATGFAAESEPPVELAGRAE